MNDKKLVGAIDGDKLVAYLNGSLRVPYPSRSHIKSRAKNELLNGIISELESGRFSLPQADMTPEEALTEARKRWGKNGTAEFIPSRFNVSQNEKYRVGFWDESANCPWMRYGDSFRAAFSDAEKREGKG